MAAQPIQRRKKIDQGQQQIVTQHHRHGHGGDHDHARGRGKAPNKGKQGQQRLARIEGQQQHQKVGLKPTITHPLTGQGHGQDEQIYQHQIEREHPHGG